VKAVRANVVKALPVGARLKVVDNSGAKIIEIISVKGYKGVKGRIAKGGVADIITGTIKSGQPDVKHKVLQAVIVRQKKEYRRADGSRIKFDDNAAIIIKDLKSGEPKGTVIKGPIAREVIDRFPTISRIAKVIM
jgi:large subunit ribosomal protein L14